MKINWKIMLVVLGFVFASPVQSFSQVSGDVHIRVAPPRPEHEERGPRPDRTSVWISGYHEYDPATNSYHWHAGRWDHPPHAGAVWVAPKYRRAHGEYKFYEGRWK